MIDHIDWSPEQKSSLYGYNSISDTLSRALSGCGIFDTRLNLLLITEYIQVQDIDVHVELCLPFPVGGVDLLVCTR